MVQFASTTLPQSPDDAYEAQRFSRQRKIADMLAQQGAEALPAGQMVSGRFVPTPWTQGLAKALQTFGGFYLNKQADEKERDFSKGLVQKQIDAFRGMYGLQQPQADPMAPMGDPDRPIVEEAAPADPYKHSFSAVPADPTSLTPAPLSTGAINTVGRPPMEAPPAPTLTPMQELMANVLRSSEQSGMPPNAILQSPAVQMQIAALMKSDEPRVVAPGASIVQGNREIYTNPKEATPRNRQIVMSGGPPDAQGRPTETPMMLDESGRAVPIEGVQPLSKGPLATASASVSTKDAFKNERELRNDLKSEPIYKAHQEVRSAYDQIKSGLKLATPIADVAAATKIMKLLDPGSVVRESELGIAMSSTGLLDRVSNYANTIIKGQRITPQQREEFQALADEFFKMSEQQFNAKANEYKGIASDYGLNADRVGGKAATPAGSLSVDEVKELEDLRKRFGKK
jgi:hypothetical protein